MSTLTQRKHLKDVSADAPVAPESERAVDPNPYLAGEVISDRYRLTREIGRGGMGVVWVAHSLVLGIDVAVKLIRADAAGPAWASRMAREAQAAARLGHPAMVRVFDFGWTNRGDPFLVMEFVQGDTLAKIITEEGPMPAIRAVQTMLPIADGLRLAHERSIIHRDIKPDNILLSADGLGRLQPKLLDFGIAKVEQNQTDGKLTQYGAVLGSPEYMSPEQARGLDNVDGRSDVWSLAIALYEMICGDVPFRHPNYNALMQAIINEPPPSLAERGLVDQDLWQIIERALSKNVDIRYSGMAEFGESLALWLYQHGIKEDLSGNSIRALWLDTPMSQHGTPVPRSITASFARVHTGQVPTILTGRMRRSATFGRLLEKRFAWGSALILLLAVAALTYNRRAFVDTAQPPPPPAEPEVAPLSTPVVAAAAERQGDQPKSAAAGSASAVAPNNSEKATTTRRAGGAGRTPTPNKPSKAHRDFGF